MIKNYNSIVLLLALLCSGATFAQSTQKKFINYQGVARNAENQLMANESMTIGVALKFGASNAATVYEEIHTVTTDANGVFSLKIGNGASIIGDYDTLNWGQEAVYLSTSFNGKIIGTTEMMAVPYALSSGDADNQSATEVPYNNAASGLSATNTQEAIDELVGSGAVDADADPTNEIQTISFDAVSNEISLTDGGTITIPSGGTDADPENELQTLNFDSATNELSLTDGNTVTIPSGGTDADADPTNEIQTISFDVATNEISLTDGGTITIPSGGTDADADPTNELQDISLVGTELTITDGSTLDLAPIVPPGGTDNQNLVLTGNVLTIESGTGSVDLNTYRDDADADPTNEVDVTEQTGILVGDGSAVTGLLGTADGQVAKWDTASSTWIAGTDDTGSGGGGSSPWKIDVGDLYYDGGNVGIGIAPTSLLHVHSASGGSTKYTTGTGTGILDGVQIGVTNDLSGVVIGYFKNQEDGPLHFGTNNVTRMQIDNLGNVGIGTSGPTAKLDVDGSIRSSDLVGTEERNVMADATGNLIIGTGGGSSGLEKITQGANSGWRLKGVILANYGHIGDNAVDLSISTNPSTTRGATGKNSTTMGYKTIASHFSSTAMGGGAEASGAYSTAMGFSTKAESFSSLAIGRYNIGGSTFIGRSNWRAEDPLFEIGNGSNSSTKHNALTVLKNGNVGIGNHTPTSVLEVAHGKTQPTASDFTNALSIKNLEYDESWQLHAAHDLVLYKDGNLRGAFNSSSGAYLQLSDRRMKKDITPLGNGTLNKVMRLKPVSYLMKDQKDAKRNLGLISQEVQEVFPSLTNFIRDSGLLALSYTQLIPILVKAVQEQQETIDSLKHKIDIQDTNYDALLDRLVVLEKTQTFKKNSAANAKK